MIDTLLKDLQLSPQWFEDLDPEHRKLVSYACLSPILVVIAIAFIIFIVGFVLLCFLTGVAIILATFVALFIGVIFMAAVHCWNFSKP